MTTLARRLSSRNNSRLLRHSFVDNEYADTQYTSKNVQFDMGDKKRGSV